MSLALTAAQIALAIVMLIAANGKLLRSDEFIAALRLSRLPEAAVGVAAVGTPIVEAALAFWLVLAPAASLPAAFATTAAVLAIFTGWMASVRARRLYIRCGCFGGGGEVGAATILRNLVFLALAVAGTILSVTVPSRLPGFSFEAVLAAIPIALAVALGQALWMVWPHLVVRYDQLRGGRQIWEGE